MALKTVISLKDNYTAVIRTIRKETSNFGKQVINTKNDIDKLQRNKKELKIKAKMENLKPKIDKLKSTLDRFKKPIMISLAYKEIGKEKLAKIKNKTQMILLKAKDFTAPVINKIKNGLGSLGSFAKKVGVGIGVGLLTGLGTGIHGSLALEQQKVSMNHFIGIQNKGMSKDQVSKTSDDYVKWLRGNANKTPFETGEVIGAGARAVNVAGGNVDQAKGLVQLAENMAALNPGKSVMDAMEALADLKLGEAERMKEFGFKLSADDFTGGKGKMSDMNPQQFADAYSRIVSTKLNPFFEGGAEKIAQTRQGQLSTIIGVGKSILTDVSTKLLQKDGGSLGKIADYMSNNADKIVGKISSVMDNLFSNIETGWGYILTGFTLLKPYLMPIANLFKTGFSDRITLIKSLFEQWKPTIMEVWGMLTNAFTKLWPVVSNIFTNAWGLIKSVITAISPVVQQVISTLVTIINTYVVPVIGFIGTMISGAIKLVKGVFDIVSPVLGGFVTGVLKGLQGIIEFLAGIFTGNWKRAWDGVLGIANGVIDTIVGAFKSIGKAMDFFTGGGKNKAISTTVNTVTSTKDNPMGNPVNTKFKPHAVGLNRVPRDNYPAMLHEGEKVLTAQEARQGKGNNNINMEMLIARIVEILGKTSKEVKVEIAKIADSIIIREEADIYKIANAIAEKLEGVQKNLT